MAFKRTITYAVANDYETAVFEVWTALFHLWKALWGWIIIKVEIEEIGGK